MGCRQSTPIADINMFRIRSTRWPTDDEDNDAAAEEDFSPMLEESTVGVISNVAADAVKYQSLSFNSFHDAASEFLKANSDTLNNISKLKDEISSNPDLVDFVTKHLNNNIETLDFLTAIKISIQKARDAERLVHHAVVHFDHHNHEAALKKLLQFNEEGNPFTDECIEKFKDAIKRHNSILEDLHLHKNELITKTDNVKTWRKVWKIVYCAAFATVLISAFVLAALAAPMAIIAPFTVAASAMPPLKELVNWVLNKFQSPHDGEGEAISSLKDGTNFAIHELNNIKARVEELMTNNIEPKADRAKLTIEEKEALKVAMVDIKFMAKTFVKSVDVLEKEVDQHVKELKKKTVTILEKFSDSLKKKKKFGIPIVKNIKKKKSNSRKKSGKKSSKRN